MTRTTRLFLVTAISASLVGGFIPRSQAHHRPQVYCSESGDLCQTTGKVDGVRRLQIRTFAKYFGRYRLCVNAPDDSRKCKRFRMHETDSGSWASSIRWRRHFPNKGDGAYTVTWRSKGTRIGPRLGFHVG